MTLPQVRLHPIVEQTEPSEEQRPAVASHASEIVVTAGAGSGKTRTLTGRVLALLAEGMPLRSIVAVTFTVKAAREMRNRVRGEVHTYLRRSDLSAAERSRWDAVERELDGARIGTIHALCSEILRFHPAEASVDPDFGLLTESEAAIARADAVADALEWAASAQEAEALFTHFSPVDLQKLASRMVQRRLDLEDSFRNGVDAPFRRGLSGLAELVRGFMDAAETQAEIEALRAAFDFAQGHPAARDDKLYPQIEAALKAWAGAEAAVQQQEWLKVATCLADVSRSFKGSVGIAKSWGGFDPKPAVKGLTIRFKDHLLFLTQGDPEADNELLDLFPAFHALFAVLCKRYASLKAARRVLDFDDLEQRALALLQIPQVQTYWQGQIQALLVDEFQDTNRRQAELVCLLCPDPQRRFVVGDARQSIYRFRGADVRIFHQWRERVLAERGECFELSVSYRTHAALMDHLNTLMQTLLGEESHRGASLTPFTPLTANRLEPDEAVRAPFLELHLAQGAKSDGSLESAAAVLARRLLELHDAGVAWEHFAVLCRSSSAFTAYEDAFDRARIPYSTVVGRGFHDRPEVRDILNALRAIRDPYDNLALTGLLRSPAIGFSDAGLLALHDRAPKDHSLRPLPGGLCAALQESGEPLAKRAVAIVQDLHAQAGRTAVSNLIKRLLDESGYVAALMQEGRARLARNLAKLIDDANAGREFSVDRYLRSIENLRAVSAREGEAHADEEGAVQIMTVHMAKGLESPIVILGDASHQGRPGDEPLTLSGGVLSIRLPRRGKKQGILFQFARAHEDAMDKAEENRLLYVAATRAREMVLVNATLIAGSAGAGWLGQIAQSLDLVDVLKSATPVAGAPTLVDAGADVKCIVWASESPLTGVAGSDKPSASDTSPVGAGAPHFDPRMVEWRREPSRPVTDDADVSEDDLWDGGQDSVRHTTGEVVGRLVHDAIAAWRFPDADPHFEEWLRTRIRREAMVNPRQAYDVEKRVCQLLRRLAAHPLHEKIARSPERHFEVPFVGQGGSDGSQKPAYGRIDLLFRLEDGGWAVVDFKSEHLHTQAMMRDAAARRYEVQIRAYGRAVEAILDAAPALFLCFLDVGGQVRLLPISPSADSKT